MIAQPNKHRTDINYKLGDLIFLKNKNIITDRPSRKLDYKRLGPFKVIAKAGSLYKLDLLSFIHIHLVIYIDRLTPASTDPLNSQKMVPLPPIIVNEKDEWEVDEVLNSRLYRRGKRL